MFARKKAHDDKVVYMMPELVKYRLMLEEYRISLFAQSFRKLWSQYLRNVWQNSGKKWKIGLVVGGARVFCH